MGRPSKYSAELRRRAVDEVLDRERKIPEVTRQLGIGSPETLRKWVRQAEQDRGLKPGPTTEELTATINWISWYNTTRLDSELGDISPAEHEADHYRHANAAAPAA